MIVSQWDNHPHGGPLDRHALPDEVRHLLIIEDIARHASERARAHGAVLEKHGKREHGMVSLAPDGTAQIIVREIDGYPRGTVLRFLTMSQLYRWLFDACPPDALPVSLRIAPPDPAAIIAAFGASAGEPPLYCVGVPVGGTERVPVALPSVHLTRKQQCAARARSAWKRGA